MLSETGKEGQSKLQEQSSSSETLSALYVHQYQGILDGPNGARGDG